MTASIVRKYLEELVNNESGKIWSNYTPDGIRQLLNRIGNPHLSLRSIHIAGTNGKGSTAHMLECIFRSAGYSTGLYTSPHLLRYNERIRINNMDISDIDLAECLEFIMPYVREFAGILTFFDVMTAVAFHYFCKKNVDIAIIEAGLGGRLDSTNVIQPLCSVITSISLDHTAILGSNLTSIAVEKAGIIKDNVPVVISTCSDDVFRIFSEKAMLHKAPIMRLGDRISYESIDNDKGQIISINFESGQDRAKLSTVKLGLHGDYQTVNAALAITAALSVRNYYPLITDSLLSLCLSDIKIPGRMELLGHDPLILFDPAHNPAAVMNLVQYLDKFYRNNCAMIVLSLMADKDSDTIFKILADRHICTVFFELDDPRGLQADEVRKKNYPVESIADSPEELFRILESLKKDLTIFTGTFRVYPVALRYNNTMPIKT